MHTSNFFKNRKILITIAIFILFLLQWAPVYKYFSQPFYDGRLHYNFDNTLFTKMAFDGNNLWGGRDQFWITSIWYAKEWKMIWEPSYYTHHPFIIKALFQQITKIFWYEEYVSRIFYFLINFVILLTAFFIVLKLTNSIILWFAWGLFLLCIPLFLSFQTVVKYETDGILFIILNLLSFIFLFKDNKKWPYIITSFLIPFSHYWAYVYFFFMNIFLLVSYFFNKDKKTLLSFWYGTISSIVWFISYIFLVIYIKWWFNLFFDDLFGAYQIRSNQDITSYIPFSNRLERQSLYIEMNFTYFLFFLFLILVSYFIVKIIKSWKKIFDTQNENFIIILWFISTLMSAMIWQFTFIQWSFIHNFWQYYFIVPFFLGFIWTLHIFYTKSMKYTIWWFTIFFLIFYSISWSKTKELSTSQMWNKEQINYLKTLKTQEYEKNVFIPVINHQVNARFDGPIFSYYTLRWMSQYNDQTLLKNNDKIFILNFWENQKKLLEEIKAKINISLYDEKCIDFFCAYTYKK